MKSICYESVILPDFYEYNSPVVVILLLVQKCACSVNFIQDNGTVNDCQKSYRYIFDILNGKAYRVSENCRTVAYF
jgi:hypothetical protein